MFLLDVRLVRQILKVHHPILIDDYSCLLLHVAISSTRSVHLTCFYALLKSYDFVTFCYVHCPTREALLNWRHEDL